MPRPSVERVKELLAYDPETGQLTWLVNRPRVKVGDVAGWIDKSVGRGYWKVRIDGANCSVARVAVVLMTGKWPEHEVDHADYDTLNNRWVNLREATRSQNQMNRTVRQGSFTNVKGVRFQQSAHGNKCGYYVAQIGMNGKRVYLGSFKTSDEAAAAYAGAAKLHHKKFART